MKGGALYAFPDLPPLCWCCGDGHKIRRASPLWIGAP